MVHFLDFECPSPQVIEDIDSPCQILTEVLNLSYVGDDEAENHECV